MPLQAPAPASIGRFEAARVAAIRATDEFRRLTGDGAADKAGLAEEMQLRTQQAVEELERYLRLRTRPAG